SIKTRAQVEAAPLDLLDYVCIGGVFETSSKDNREPPVRPDRFAALAAQVRSRAPNMPIGATAGNDQTNRASVIAAGAGRHARIRSRRGRGAPARHCR